MSIIPYIIEISMLLLLAFLAGCVVGYLLRSLAFAASSAKKTQPKSVVEHVPGRRRTLAGPDAGGKDDLRQIKGIGPTLEKKLNDLGIFHFGQIAAWDGQAIARMEERLSFKGCIARDKWIEQARNLKS